LLSREKLPYHDHERKTFLYLNTDLRQSNTALSDCQE